MNDYLKHKELYHYGIKGQRWGVVRTPEELGREDRKVYDSLSDKDKKTYMKFTSEQRKKFNSLPSKSEKKVPSNLSKYENEDGTLTDEGRKVLENVANKHGFVSNINRDSSEANKNGKTLLLSSDDLAKYKKDQEEVDKIIKDLFKQNVSIVTSKVTNKKGEQFVAYAFDNGKLMQDMEKRSVYYYKYQ